MVTGGDGQRIRVHRQAGRAAAGAVTGIACKAGAHTGGITAGINASKTASRDVRNTTAIGDSRASRSAVEREAYGFTGHRR